MARIKYYNENSLSWEYADIAGGGSASSSVQSVNGQIGVVSLTASDVGALPDTTVIPEYHYVEISAGETGYSLSENYEQIYSWYYNKEQMIFKFSWLVSSQYRFYAGNGEIPACFMIFFWTNNVSYSILKIYSNGSISYINIDGLATEEYVDTKVADLVNSAPETLDTLNELAAALGNDENFATTVTTQIGTKVDKVEGKGLSTEDYTTEEKTKLAGVEEGAKVNVQTDWDETDTSSDAYIANKPIIPSKTSELTNDSGFLTTVPDEYVTETELSAKGYLTSYTETDPTVPDWAKQSAKPAYTADEVGALPDTTVIPSKTSELTNDSGFLTVIPDEYITETELTGKGYLTSYTETDPTVPAWAKADTKPTYTAAEVGALPADTVIPSIDGLASESYVDSAVAAINAVPAATTTDNGKVLSVVDGQAAWVTPSYSILPITQEEYDALTTKDASTLYIIEV